MPYRRGGLPECCPSGTTIISMFELYAEEGRRVLLFARQHASNAGATRIESQHLLLGILQETPSVIYRHFPQELDPIKNELLGGQLRGAKASDVGLPLSNESKRILPYAADSRAVVNNIIRLGTATLIVK